MTNFNNIPSHWQIKKIGEVCNIIMGQSPPSNTYNIQGIGLPFFQGKSEFKEIHPVTIKWCTKPKKIAEPNDVLLSVRAPVGSTNIADQKCCIGRGLAAIRYDNFKFVFYFLRSIENQLDKKGMGTTFKAITGEVLRNFEIPLPPPTEQHAIVSKIEELFSELDKGKEQLQTALQQLKVYRQSLLKAAFEGRLTNKNVKDGELPEGWKWAKVSEVCKKILGGGTPSTKNLDYWNGQIPWITSADILGIKDIKPRRKITGEAIIKSATNLLPKGGIIIVTRVGLGKLAVAPYDLCFSQDSQGLILKKEIISTEYALWVLHQNVKIFKYKSRGTTINGVTKKQLAELEFPLPSPKEQQLIVQELESKLTVCDKLEEAIKQGLQQAETLRQSILKKAFEGKLVRRTYN